MAPFDLTGMIKPKNPTNFGGLFAPKPSVLPKPPAPISPSLKPNMSVMPKPASQTDPAKVAASSFVKKAEASTDTSGGSSTPVKPPVVPNSGQTSAIEDAAKKNNLMTQLLNAKQTLGQAQGAGYGTNEEIKTDGNGTIMPKPAPAPEKSPFQEFVESGRTALGNAADIKAQEAKLRENITKEELGVLGDPNRAQSVRTGMASQIEANRGAELTGLAGEEQAATQRGQSYFDAAGKVSPIQVPYSNQVINPLTGEPINGNGIAGGSLGGAVSDVSSRVRAGTMTFDEAKASLSSYGQGGVNALLKALGPDFNVNQSNTLAGQQGTIKPAYQFAQTALTNLQKVTDELGKGFLQGTNVPGVNSLGNFISHTFGVNSEQTRRYAGAVSEARNAYAQLLAASKGGTPSDYGDQARSAIPDEPTPNDIKAAMENLTTLGGAKVNIYGNAGNAGQENNQSGGSIYDF